MMQWGAPGSFDSCSQHTATKLFTLSADARPSPPEASLPLYISSKRTAKLLPVPEVCEMSEAGSEEKLELEASGGACSLGSSLSWRFASHTSNILQLTLHNADVVLMQCSTSHRSDSTAFVPPASPGWKAAANPSKLQSPSLPPACSRKKSTLLCSTSLVSSSGVLQHLSSRVVMCEIGFANA